MNAPLALVVALLAAAPPSELVRRANELFNDRRFAEASAAYAEAYEDEHDPSLLYGWAQSERLAGNCVRALELYREYAELPVGEENRNAAAQNAKRCGGDIDTPADPRPLHDRSASSDGARPAAWKRDALGLSLVSGGAALGIVTLALGVQADRQRSDAENADTESSYARRIGRWERTRTATIVCGSLGAATFIAGVIRLATVGKKDDPATRAWIPGRGVRF